MEDRFRALFFEEVTERGGLRESIGEGLQGGNLGDPVAARLLAGFQENALPAFEAFCSGAVEPLFAAIGGYGNKSLDSELGAFFEDPFEAVEFDQRNEKGQADRERRGCETLEDLEENSILSRLADLGQVDAAAVGDFVALAGFDAEDAGEVVRFLAGNFGALMMDLWYKEPASCHDIGNQT